MARNTLENTVETYAVTKVATHGGKSIKLTNYRGIPDRLILFPGGIVAFAEFKRPSGGRFSKAQQMWQRLIEHLGLSYYSPCTREEVNAMIEELING